MPTERTYNEVREYTGPVRNMNKFVCSCGHDIFTLEYEVFVPMGYEIHWYMVCTNEACGMRYYVKNTQKWHPERPEREVHEPEEYDW
jgi:hypothetical protein